MQVHLQYDRIGAKLISDIGLETMMWGSDYPHTDGVWPESSKYIEEQFAELTPEQVHAITCANAAKFYRPEQLGRRRFRRTPKPTPRPNRPPGFLTNDATPSLRLREEDGNRRE